MDGWEQYGIAGVLAAVLFVVAQIGLQWIKSRKDNGNGKGELDDGKTRDQCLREIYRMTRQVRDWHDPERVGSLKQVGDRLLPTLDRIMVEVSKTEASRAAIVAQFETTTARVNKLLDVLEHEHRGE